MCGRYTIFQTGELKSRFKASDTELDELLEDLRANYNVAPGQTLPVVTRRSPNKLELMRWGLIPVWAKDPKIGYRMINARAESVFEKPSWKRPVLKQRCLVPANGFYEWKQEDGGKQPYYIHAKDQKLFAFAGVWDHWTDKTTGEVVRSFSIITTEPNRQMAAIHDRMPVMLSPADEDRWLDPDNDSPESIADLLKPYKNGKLDMYEVSKDVNSVRNNDEHLIDPLDEK